MLFFTAHKGCYYPLPFLFPSITDPYLDNLVTHKCKLASSGHLDYPYMYVYAYLQAVTEEYTF